MNKQKLQRTSLTEHGLRGLGNNRPHHCPRGRHFHAVRQTVICNSLLPCAIFTPSLPPPPCSSVPVQLAGQSWRSVCSAGPRPTMLSGRSACHRWRLQCRFGGQDVCRGGARGRGWGGDAGRLGRAYQEGVARGKCRRGRGRGRGKMRASAGPCVPTPLYLDTPHLVQVANGARSSEHAYLAFLPLAVPRK